MILHGDCVEHMKDMGANSVDAIVTDPPYGLSFMGKKWDYNIPSIEVWQAAIRVIKPGGHLLSFGGTRTYHRMVCTIEDAGFEIRDQLQWLYGSGFPKSMNLKGDWKGWGTALKPANEPIVLARKPLSEKTVKKNVLRWGTGALNIDESRIGMSQNTKTKFASNANQKKTMGEFKKWNGEYHIETQGRWPANLLLDEQAAEMLDRQSGFLHKAGNKRDKLKPSPGGFGGSITGMKNPNYHNDEGGGASRFFYVAKTSKKERNAGLAVHRFGAGIGEGKDPKAPTIDQNNHPTVKPIRLMEHLIKLVTPPCGIVLDPFAGSGSTGVAAFKLGFGFIGIEMHESYCEIARRRISAVTG